MKRAYEYVGAGLFSPYHMGLAIYIKYKGSANEVRLIEQSSRHVHIVCPDRELYIVNDKHFEHPYQPPFSYDEVVNVSPFWALHGNATGIQNYMMNYSQYIGKEQQSAKLRKHGRSPLHNQTIFADSGGFQLKSGKFDYISPKKLVEWYNDNVDIGLVLDIPSSGYFWPGLIEKMAKAQSSNIDVMLKHKRPDLELLNIFHGQNIKDIEVYRSIVERPEIERTAIGGAYYHTILQSIDHACQVMTQGRKYKHYHMLGIGNIRQIYALMRMASKGIAEYITSDSSSFLQEAMNKGYFVCPTISSPPRYLNIGDKYSKPNAGQTLPCSCPVCKSLKYMDVLNSFTGNILAFMLLYHNLFRFTQHTEAMYDVISTATKKDLKDLLRAQLETRKFGRDEVLACIDYVDDFAEGGRDYAAQNLSYFLTQPEESESADTMPTLFGSGATEQRDTTDTLDESNPIRVRMEQVLDRFITNQSDKHEKVAIDKRIIKTEGHMTEASGYARLPGKAKLKKAKASEKQLKEKELREKEKAKIKVEREEAKKQKVVHKTAKNLGIQDNASAIKSEIKRKPKAGRGKKVNGNKET